MRDETFIGDAQVAPGKKKIEKKKGKSGPSPTSSANRAALNQVNSRTGYRNRRYECGGEFHLLPHCPGRQPNAVRRVSIATETPDEGGKDVLGGAVYKTSVELGVLYSGSVRHSTAIIDTGASANLVGANWLNNHNAIRKASGRPLAKITPASSSYRYGDGRVGDVHRAAVVPIAIVGYAGHFMAYVVDADFPASLGQEALETLGGHLDFCERVLALELLGADIPLEMSAVGHYLLNVADFPKSNSAG